MNKKDIKLLRRLKDILEAVPFSASGTATKTGQDAIMYEEDMRALKPYVRKIIDGMIMQNF